jgi:hypothetical protein
LDFKFKTEIFGNVITFLSIEFGFYITTLAIFVTSKYVSDLYKITNGRDRSVTLLHALLNNYKFGFSITLSSLVYIIFAQFFIEYSSSDSSYIYLENNLIFLPFMSILSINFYYCFVMLNDLIKVIIQEAKNRAKSHERF